MIIIASLLRHTDGWLWRVRLDWHMLGCQHQKEQDTSHRNACPVWNIGREYMHFKNSNTHVAYTGFMKFFLIYFHKSQPELEKATVPHSSTLAWKILWTGEPGRLQSMGSRTVRHDWATSISLFTFMHWRKKCQPTPVFLPRESQGWGCLVGCHLWGLTESDMTEAT